MGVVGKKFSTHFARKPLKNPLILLSGSATEAHGSKFTPEQKRAWAHLIELGRHTSYDVPPKKRFFQQEKSAVISSATTATAVSPGRRVGIRSECIDQLHKWHTLHQLGAVTKKQYDKLQTSILSDIQNL